MPIALDEVLKFGDRWLTTVLGRGSPAAQAAFFLHPDSRFYMVESGETMTFEDNTNIHSQLIHDSHTLGDFTLTALSSAPERVRATGRFYWQAEYARRRSPNLIQAVVGVDWILERAPSGELKFVLYLSGFHQLLPDSAPLDFDQSQGRSR